MNEYDLVREINERIKKIDKFNISEIVLDYSGKRKTQYKKFICNVENYFIILDGINKLCKEIKELKSYKEKFKYKESSKFDIDKSDIDMVVYSILKYSFVNVSYYGVKEKDFKKLNRRCVKKELDANILKETIKNDLQNNKDCYYRGQSDYSWHISSSITRDLNDSVKIDKEYINMLYEKNDLNNKYNEFIGDKNNLYNKYCFLQHSLAYSTLIDFTSNIVIGTDFALCNVDKVNAFSNNPAKLTKIEIKDKSFRERNVIYNVSEINNILSNKSYIRLNTTGFSFGKDEEYTEYNCNGKTKKKKIHFDTFDEILNHLIPECFIFLNPVNDRMKYQKGLFMYFCGEDFVVFKTRFIFEYVSFFKITDYTIKEKDKREILNFIYKDYRYYDNQHIMNPYLYFKE